MSDRAPQSSLVLPMSTRKVTTMETLVQTHRLRGTEIHALSIFKVVVEVGGLSRAANFLNVDLSTVSRQIKGLEIRYGFELCERGRGGFALTRKGQIVYDVSCFMVESLKTCDERLEGLRGGLSGTLRIGLVSHLLLAPKLPFHEILHQMRKKAPDLVVDCEILSPIEIMRQVEYRRLHLGILGTIDQPNTLKFFHIFEEEAGLYCSRNHPLFDTIDTEFDVTNLKGMRYVSRKHSSPSDLRATSLGLVADTMSNDVDVILSSILSGIYLGFLPVHIFNSSNLSKDIRRLPLKGGECKVPFFTCTRKHSTASRRERLFMHTLEKVVSNQG